VLSSHPVPQVCAGQCCRAEGRNSPELTRHACGGVARPCSSSGQRQHRRARGGQRSDAAAALCAGASLCNSQLPMCSTLVRPVGASSLLTGSAAVSGLCLVQLVSVGQASNRLQHVGTKTARPTDAPSYRECPGVLQAEPATLASLVGAFTPQAADGRLARAARRALKPGAGTGGADGVRAPQTPPRALTEDDLWPLRQVSAQASGANRGNLPRLLRDCADSTREPCSVPSKHPVHVSAGTCLKQAHEHMSA